MSKYEVRAVRLPGSGLWELHIPTVGVTQTADLEDAEALALDYISIVRDIHVSSISVQIVVEEAPNDSDD
jgi:hypothetical protein